MDEHHVLAAKHRVLELRARLLQCIRMHLSEQGFLEVETPLRIPAPAPEEHIEAFPSDGWFLQTSPELCMKRLLSAGYRRIFQICRCFRAGERGALHLPEFTMLEWYVADADYLTLMEQCQNLLISILQKMGCGLQIRYQDKTINLAPPWKKMTVADAFARYASADCIEAAATDHFEEILTEKIEPHLSEKHPVFLYDYPAKFGALARLKKDHPAFAERFELYIGGLEIANGFSELTCAEEQRSRFMKTLQRQTAKQSITYPLPEKFLLSLDKMPPSAGIALGIDRLMMLLADTRRIDDVVAFTPEIL